MVRLFDAVVRGADARRRNHLRLRPVAAHRRDDGLLVGLARHLRRVCAGPLSPLLRPHAVLRHGQRAAGDARGDHRLVAAVDAGGGAEDVRLSRARRGHDLAGTHAARHGLCDRRRAIAFAGDEQIAGRSCDGFGLQTAPGVFLVTLPNITQALASAWLLTFTLSLDDVVLSAFLSGPGSSTMPIVIFSRARLGLDPRVNAVAALTILVVSIAIIGSGIIMAGAERKRQKQIRAASMAD